MHLYSTGIRLWILADYGHILRHFLTCASHYFVHSVFMLFTYSCYYITLALPTALLFYAMCTATHADSQTFILVCQKINYYDNYAVWGY